MSTAGSPAPGRALHPYARQRLTGRFTELIRLEEELAVALRSLAGPAPTGSSRSVLLDRAARHERDAALLRSLAARFSPSGCLLEEPAKPGPAARRAVGGGADPLSYARLGARYLLFEGVLADSLVAALRTELRVAAAPEGFDAALGGLAEAADARRTRVREALTGLTGVRAGWGARNSGVLVTGLDDVVRALVVPERGAVVPMIPVALTRQARALTGQWSAACERAVALLAAPGFSVPEDDVRERWWSSTREALSEYRRLRGREHCVVRAAAAGLSLMPLLSSKA
ncbi:hypothetical protein QWJ26_06035 [Streptomyces sp. CSDS2]|uniref:hypothetical protein n=1 Tax=Streptomyces sp. CSDS2 TaxID=3055051 RepID=UPI0025B2640C|nr:hypothetical protein [Streptomyces sp. CSDS2]MDN3259380.1 hypothetical protein [Streptomyces sp. CSDS2]